MKAYSTGGGTSCLLGPHPDNAGLVYFHMRRELGTLRLDGGWLNGREGNWMVWELTKVEERIPVSAQARLEESSTFTVG